MAAASQEGTVQTAQGYYGSLSINTRSPHLSSEPIEKQTRVRPTGGCWHSWGRRQMSSASWNWIPKAQIVLGNLFPPNQSLCYKVACSLWYLQACFVKSQDCKYCCFQTCQWEPTLLPREGRWGGWGIHPAVLENTQQSYTPLRV